MFAAKLSLQRTLIVAIPSCILFVLIRLVFESHFACRGGLPRPFRAKTMTNRSSRNCEAVREVIQSSGRLLMNQQQQSPFTLLQAVLPHSEPREMSLIYSLVFILYGPTLKKFGRGRGTISKQRALQQAYIMQSRSALQRSEKGGKDAKIKPRSGGEIVLIALQIQRT